MSYGIGRVPGDVDPTSEAMAGIEAVEIMPRVTRAQPQGRYIVCKRCGQDGYSGGYPFSTCASSGLCDDCF